MSKESLLPFDESTKIWHFNSWFEWELESLVRTGSFPELNRQKRNRNHFLERLFLSVAPETDSVYLGEPIPPQLLNHWKARDWKTAGIYPGWLENQSDVRISVEFGDVRTGLGWEKSAHWNSRVAQTLFQNEIEYESFPLRVFHSAESAQDWLEDWSLSPSPILWKKDYSSSGRGHTLLRSPKDIHRLAKMDFPLVCEPFAEDRFYDFGLLFHAEDQGVRFLTASEMQIGTDFQFKGLAFYPEEMPEPLLEAVQLVLLGEGKNPEFPAEWLPFLGDYRGPLAWDGFLNRNGNHRKRAEINIRYSMGRIGYEVRQRVARFRPQNPYTYGIYILHQKETLFPKPEWELLLTLSVTEPWRILYSESSEPLRIKRT